MAFIDDQQTNFKHFCRICKKGFMCGRALGGHMRAHGIGDESTSIDDEDPGSDWEDRGNVPTNKSIYALRTNPNRLKCCRVCENCGMEFISWKSFLEHGKCNFDDQDRLSPSPPSSDGDDEQRKNHRWSKKKRTFGEILTEEDAATCLMMLSNADETESSRASISKEDDPPIRNNNVSYLDKAKGVAKGQFECKACKKVFNSHQALGGHRASHKKVKGCFAARLDLATGGTDDVTQHDFLVTAKSASSNFYHGGSSRRKSKVHECTICHRIFSSGQALGGHKRCHWITSNGEDPMDQIHYQRPEFYRPGTVDLNFPSAGNDIAGIRRGPNNALSFEVSTEINLQSWPDINNQHDDNKEKNIAENITTDNNTNTNNNNNNNNDNMMKDVDDEADSKVKLAKLSDLKDMSLSNGSSSWLQVGISSTTTNIGSDA